MSQFKGVCSPIFKDFAGSGVIGLTGGALALIASLIVGPRWDRRGESRWRLLPVPEGHNATVSLWSLSVAMLPCDMQLLVNSHEFFSTLSKSFQRLVHCTTRSCFKVEYHWWFCGGVRAARRCLRQSDGHERVRWSAQHRTRRVQLDGGTWSWQH